MAQAGEAALDAFIARLRGLRDLARAVAVEAAPALEEAERARASSGLDPDGQAWAARKDGTRALANVASKIVARAKGTVLELVVPRPYTYHQYSKGGRLPVRRVIPDGGAGMPANIARVVREAARRVFLRTMGLG